MIKVFGGGGGAEVVTPSKPPPLYEQLLPLPTPYFKMFLEISLNDPPPPHFKHLSLLLGEKKTVSNLWLCRQAFGQIYLD